MDKKTDETRYSLSEVDESKKLNHCTEERFVVKDEPYRIGIIDPLKSQN